MSVIFKHVEKKMREGGPPNVLLIWKRRDFLSWCKDVQPVSNAVKCMTFASTPLGMKIHSAQLD